jgi:hypothetical protein
MLFTCFVLSGTGPLCCCAGAVLQVEKALAIPPSMQKLMYKGLLKNDTDTLEKVSRKAAASCRTAGRPCNFAALDLHVSCAGDLVMHAPGMIAGVGNYVVFVRASHA